MKTPEPLKLSPKTDPRMRIYNEIGRVHRDLVEGSHRAAMAQQRMDVDVGPLIMHCEQSIAFLAEEILRLGALVEKGGGVIAQP